MQEELKNKIAKGEKIDVELKRAEKALNKDVYETVCSFNNRDGGDLFLGVVDETREIVGVDSGCIDKMIKDFTTSINNPKKINPPMYLTPVLHEIDGKQIIHIHVPEGTQLRRLNGRIYDRTYEGDIDITDNAELVYKMYARKQSTYFVNKVYPKFGMNQLDFDVIQRAKKMAMSRMENHPWANMNEEEILRSSGLILVDPDTGREGITLAAILLFGRDSTIMSVLPQYRTDAIYRVKNMDRYDDREVIITNLVDSFRGLMDFGKKHLNDVFVTEGDQSISARDKILREVVSNILAHRDYSSGYTAQFVIEKDKLYTKNSNLPHGHGELQLNKFEPFPKNPPISKVFREIGYADELGSGMRNTNKYTKMYSGEIPIFVEDNIFETIVPIEKVARLQVGATERTYTIDIMLESAEEVPKSAEEVPEISINIECVNLNKQYREIYNYVVYYKAITTAEAKKVLDVKERRARQVLSEMCDEGILVKEGATSNLKYILNKVAKGIIVKEGNCQDK